MMAIGFLPSLVVSRAFQVFVSFLKFNRMFWIRIKSLLTLLLFCVFLRLCNQHNDVNVLHLHKPEIKYENKFPNAMQVFFNRNIYKFTFE